MAANYTLGRGKIYLAEFVTDSEAPATFRYVGNTPEFSWTGETESLQHTNSDEGINEVDAEVQLSVNRTGTFTMDDMQPENLALFMFGTAALKTQAAATGQTWKISGAHMTKVLADKDGLIYVGATASSPAGIRLMVDASNKPSLAGKDSAASPQAVTLAKDTDWEIVDATRGVIRLLDTAKTFSASGTSILSELTVTYDVSADTNYQQIISGSQSFTGMLRYEENNPEGDDFDWLFPKVTLSPNGDMPLKGDEFRTIPMSISIQKPTASQAIFCNGRPVST